MIRAVLTVGAISFSHYCENLLKRKFFCVTSIFVSCQMVYTRVKVALDLYYKLRHFTLYEKNNLGAICFVRHLSFGCTADFCAKAFLFLLYQL